MLLVFFGTDRQALRDAASNYVEEKMPKDATLTLLDALEYQPGQLQDALGAASLFGGSEWYLLDTPSASGEYAAAVDEMLVEMAESPNTFVVLEGQLLAAAKKRYEKHTADIFEYKKNATEDFNTFALADALAAKDRRGLWVLLQEARRGRVTEESIIGILWWQLKALRLAAVTASAAEAGMKEFPYNKAKRALPKFSGGELERLSTSLLSLYHDGHAGVRELDMALEQWVLKG